MTNFSPKIEIINHFDKLINRVDIDFEESLEKYDKECLLSQVKIFEWKDKFEYWQVHKFEIIVFDIWQQILQHENLGLWSESTKVIDYLKQIRMNSIEELRKAQEDTLDFYKLNSSRFKSSLTNAKTIDEFKSELFAEHFYFQVRFTQSKIKLCAFNIFTFFTDFYVSIGHRFFRVT